MMKQLIFVVAMLPCLLYAGNPEKLKNKPTKEKETWVKKTVKGVLVNTTLSGQNQVIGLECRKPFDDLCLEYYVKETSTAAPTTYIHPAISTELIDNPLQVPMQDDRKYLLIPSNGTKKVYELNEININEATSDKISIDISPAIEKP